MTYVDNILGNLLIKYHDRWRGNYYLKEDLFFTPDRSDAARFYLLKPGDTSILNGDRVSIHCGNRTLVIDSHDKIKLVDRERLQIKSDDYKITSYILTNGTENTDPIGHESPLFIISDRVDKMALKYEWGMELIIPQNDIVTPSSDSNPSNYKPRSHPNLTNASYNGDFSVNAFKFSLERADGPIINAEEARSITTGAMMAPAKTMTKSDNFEGYHGIIMIILLMIVLILCIFINR
jgi:hypothetical protein